MSALATSPPDSPQQCDAVRYSRRKLPHLDKHSIPLVREWAVDKAMAWRVPPTGVANLELVISELVTNALRHTGPPRGAQALLIHQEDGAVQVEVRDCGREDGKGPAVRGAAASFAESGRGLALVAAFSHEWGIKQIIPGHPALGHVVWSHPQDSYAPVPMV